MGETVAWCRPEDSRALRISLTEAAEAPFRGLRIHRDGATIVIQLVERGEVFFMKRWRTGGRRLGRIRLAAYRAALRNEPCIGCGAVRSEDCADTPECYGLGEAQPALTNRDHTGGDR